jgi:CheY-like chemotaxis protein
MKGETRMARVLVVDDDERLCDLYAEELGERYEVLTAISAREAIDRVPIDRPDVVVLDIRMPDMDGIEALGRLLEKDRKLPVILNTAYPRFRGDFMTWAADDYVVKSSDLEPLKKAIHRVLTDRGVATAWT